MERRIAFLQAMRVQMLANRRRVPPRGLAGGGDAQRGETFVEHIDGRVTQLGATGAADVEPGDVITIRTPGGGGYGGAA